MLRVGVVGAGAMGAWHAAILRSSIAGVTLASVSDPDPDRASAAAGDGAVEVFAEADDLIGSPSVDAVVVASPDGRHFEQVMACLKRAKPVLCEKPLAPTPDACRALAAREAAIGRHLIQVGFMRRFDPAYLDLKQALEGGAVGAALLLRCTHRNAAAPGFFQANMAITNAMVHEFDICHWLLGSEIAAVRIDQPQRGIEPINDPLIATMRMTSGELVTIEVFMNATYGYDIGTEIVGEKGVLVMGAPVTTRVLSGCLPGRGVAPDFRVRFQDAYRRQLQAWADAVALRQSCGASAFDGLSAALAAEAGLKALESGEWERVQAG